MSDTFQYIPEAKPFDPTKDFQGSPSVVGKVVPALPLRLAAIGGPDQSLRRKSHWEVWVDGRNVTNILDPHLISIQVIDRIQNRAGVDECVLELDDRYASLAIPQEGSRVEVWFGWEGQGPKIPPSPPDPVNPFTGVSSKSIELPFEGSMHNMFIGYIKNVESGCSRAGGGRRMWVEAEALKPRTHAKSQRTMTQGEGDPPGLGKNGGGSQISFQDFAQKLAGSAGFSANVGSSFQNTKRNFWSADGASMLHWFNQMASQLGGNLKISGNTVHFFGANDMPKGEVLAVWGYNLIAWRIKPFLERPQFGSSQSSFFERAAGAVKNVRTLTGNGGGPFGNAIAQQQLPGQTGGPQTGQQQNEGSTESGRQDRGTGWVTINGEPTAIAFSALTLLGARPGVDGVYRIVEAEHIYSRQGGWITRCELDRPNQFFGGYEGWNQSVAEFLGSGNPGGLLAGGPYTLTEEQLRSIIQNQNPDQPNPQLNPPVILNPGESLT